MNNWMMFIDSMANFLKDWSGNLFNFHKLHALDISGKGGGAAVDARGTVLKPFTWGLLPLRDIGNEQFDDV